MTVAEKIVKTSNAKGTQGSIKKKGKKDGLKITIRVNAEFLAEVKNAAKKDGDTVAEWVRILVQRELMR